MYPLQQPGGDDLIFLDRIHPDKGVHLAIEVARLSGMRLIIAGIIQDEAHFRERAKPHLDDQKILYIGPVDVSGKNELFARARALLHLNTIPERFALVLVEANAAGRGANASSFSPRGFPRDPTLLQPSNIVRSDA